MAKKKQEEAERTKAAFEHRVGGFYSLLPEEIVIPGIDNKADNSYALYDVSTRHQIDESLVLSIMKDGVLKAITVRKDGAQAEVIDGRRRVLHAREANKRLIKMGGEPIRITASLHRPTSDKDAILLMLSNNAHGLAEDPLDRAEKMARAMKFGAVEAEVAISVGLTEHAVRDSLKLLDCSESVKNAVRSGKLAATGAIKLSALSRIEQDKALAELLSADKVTAKEAAKIAQDILAAKSAAAPPAPSDRVETPSEAPRREPRTAPSGDKLEKGDGRKNSRGSSAAYAPGRKDLREAIDIMGWSPKSEGNKGFIEGLRYALGDEVPVRLQTARELAAEAEKEAQKAAKESRKRSK